MEPGDGGMGDVEVVTGIIHSVASVRYNGIPSFGVYSKVQGDNAVALMGGNQGVDVSFGLVECFPVEYIVVVIADGVIDMGLPHWIDNDAQSGGAVAALEGMALVDERIVAFPSEHGVKTVGLVWLSDAYGIIQQDIHMGVHGDV